MTKREPWRILPWRRNTIRWGFCKKTTLPVAWVQGDDLGDDNRSLGGDGKSLNCGRALESGRRVLGLLMIHAVGEAWNQNR